MSRVGLGEDLFGRVEEWPFMLSVEIDTSLGHLSHMFVSNRIHDNDTFVKRTGFCPKPSISVLN
jgi:hypothetical protein